MLYTRFFLVILTIFTVINSSFAQYIDRVDMRTLVASGGVFEFAPPYSDYVTVGTVDSSGAYQQLDVIYTQSVQQIIVSDIGLPEIAYVAAQDSIVAYWLPGASGHIRSAAAGIPDAYGSFHSLCNAGGFLFAGEWYGGDANFLHVYNQNLQLQTSIVGIDQDVRSMAQIGDTLYIAQNIPNSAFGDSLGYISKVHIPTLTYAGRMGFGNPAFTGVSHLFNYNNTLVATTVTTSGSMIKYTPTTGATQINAIGNLGKAFYLEGNQICLLYQNKPYNCNVQTGALTDLSCYTPAGATVVAATPNFTAFGVANNLPQMFFTTDFTSVGNVHTKTGNCAYNTASVGISPEAAAIFNYFLSVPTENYHEKLQATIVPNPANSVFSIATNENTVLSVKISNVLGEIVLEKNNITNNETIDISQLTTGNYAVILQNTNGVVAKKLQILR